MRYSILDNLNILEQRINSEDYTMELDSIQEWGGADVIIGTKLTQGIKEWLGDQKIIISFQKSHARKRAVITEFSKELSWLFYQLSEIFREKLNSISKFDFYASIADSALHYLDENKENIVLINLLKTVLDQARYFAKHELTR
ncbi:MAG: hypothetical protein ACD_79C00511G0002 [uncultured bacterium]|nr:MAG: hypothetical protein ACD_79C00511G0002 [uncultured bacterium]